MADIGFEVADGDNCDTDPGIAVLVFSDEADGNRPDDKSPDVVIEDTVRLRAERDPGSDGHVYLIMTVATDAAGNQSIDCCTVTVPRVRVGGTLTTSRSRRPLLVTTVVNPGIRPRDSRCCPDSDQQIADPIRYVVVAVANQSLRRKLFFTCPLCYNHMNRTRSQLQAGFLSIRTRR